MLQLTTKNSSYFAFRQRATMSMLSGILLCAPALAQVPEGTRGWSLLPGKYYPTPEAACLSRMPHFDLYFEAYEPYIDRDGNNKGYAIGRCRYGHRLPPNAHSKFYLSTALSCEDGYYYIRWPGICLKKDDPPPPISSSPESPGYCRGNPVHVSSGGKFQREFDFRASQNGALDVVRFYRSMGPAFKHGEYLSPWKFSFELELQATPPSNGEPPLEVFVVKADQSATKFSWNGGYRSEAGEQLTTDSGAYSDWTYKDPSGSVVKFQKIATRLRPISSHTKEGVGTYYSYPDSQTTEISDDFGRSITVKYSAGVVSAIESATISATYENEALDLPPVKANRLKVASLRDTEGNLLSSNTYQFEHEPKSHYSMFWLTGIVENGNQYASYTYDRNGRVIVSEHADSAERWTFEYPSESIRIIEEPLGTKRTLKLIDGISGQRVSQIDQPGGAGCAPAAKAFEYSDRSLKSRTDFNGVKTCYWTDSRSLESIRIEGKTAGDSCGEADARLRTGQRKVSTLWHPDWNVETGIAEPLKITRFIYNGEKDVNGEVINCAENGTLPGGLPLAVICKKIEQATSDTAGRAGFDAAPKGLPRITNFTYNHFGQLLTTSAPGREGSYTYYSDTTSSHTKGDLWKFTNPKNKTTEFLEYTATGLPLRTREANGLITAYTYDPLGRTIRRVRAAGTSAQSTTEFEYDKNGLVTLVRNPDGTVVRYGYDAAHRLTDITDTSASSIHYTLDRAGNRVAEEVRDPSGRVVRRLTRTYDALNRLSAVSTGEQQ